MIPFCYLAQSLPAGGEIIGWLGALSLVGSLVLTAYATQAHRKYLREDQPKRTILPSPLTIAPAPKYLEEDRFDRFAVKTAERFEDVFKAIGHEGHRVDGRINDVLKEVSKIAGAFEQSQRRNQ